MKVEKTKLWERHDYHMGKDKDIKKEQEQEQELSLEEAFEKIEEAIGHLETEEITLEESFLAYQQGMKLLQYCNEKIDKVEKQVLKISEDGELYEF